MAAENLTPMDEQAGIPLPIFPRGDLPPVPVGRERNIERIADWHHPFHPRAALVEDGLGAMAVRNCRIQWTEYDDHHHKYHGAYAGPELPQEPEEQFKTVVLAAAGYVPRQTIRFVHGRPVVCHLDDELRESLWTSGQLRIGNTAAVRNFLIDYAFSKDFGGVNASTIDEFLHTPDEKRRKDLGSTFLGIVAYDIAQPLRSIYKESRKLNLIPRAQARTAGRFIFEAITTHKQTRALGALTKKLSTTAA